MTPEEASARITQMSREADEWQRKQLQEQKRFATLALAAHEFTQMEENFTFTLFGSTVITITEKDGDGNVLVLCCPLDPEDIEQCHKTLEME